jgi:ketosteroid isomerase-like protein
MTFARRTSVTIAQWSIKSTVVFFIFLAAFCGAVHARAQQSDNEQAVWKMEKTYWEDVKVLDLDSYRALWHENFVGWPYSSSQPARKDHITDWIAAYTDKGSRLQWFSLQPAASQSTGDLVVTHYWLTAFWSDKAGHGEPATTRVTHTWIKTDKGWQIISGMSAVVPAN